MRVLVIPNGFPSRDEPYNGIFVLRQTRELIALGHEVRVLRILPIFKVNARGSLKPVLRSYEYEGVRVDTVHRIFLPRLAALGILRAVVRSDIEAAARAFRPDVIHAHAILFSGYVSFGRSVPTVLTSHGSDAYAMPFRRPDLLRAARKTLRKVETAVGVSGFIAAKLADLGRPEARVVFNGADENLFFPRPRSEAREALGVDPDRLVFSYVGNLLEAKGIFELADACGNLHDLKPLLLVAGDGPERARFFKRLDELRVNYRNFGSVAQERVALLLGAADALVLPSHQEGLPSILCEAMLAGRATVTTPVGGIPEIIADGHTGWIVPVGDSQALAAALRRIYDMPVLTQAFERQAEAFAKKRLTWRVNARAYDKIYETTVASFGRS